MIINQVVSGQEEGNARLIVETGCGVVATSPNEVVAAAVERAFADDEQSMARMVREYSPARPAHRLTRYRAVYS